MVRPTDKAITTCEELTYSIAYQGQEDLSGFLEPAVFSIGVGQKKTLDYPRIIEILQGHSKLPSELAGINPEERSTHTKRIDELYKKAIVAYRVDFLKAAIQDYNTGKKVFCDLQSDNFFIDIGKRIWRVINCKKSFNFAEDFSSNKIYAMIVIDSEEKKRDIAIMNMIVNRAIPLFKEMNDLIKVNQVCERQQKEFNQLVRLANIPSVMRAFFNDRKVFENFLLEGRNFLLLK